MMRFLSMISGSIPLALEVLAALEKKFRISIPEERLVDITNVTNAIKVVREFVALKQAEVENPAC